MLDRFMQRFSAWFSSPSGSLQTFAVTMAIVLIEHIWPHLDPGGFLLLYWLTVYSGVTQPVLAYAAAVAARNGEATQAKLLELQEDQRQLMRNQADMMKLMLAIAERTERRVEDIAEDIEEIREEV